MPTRYTCTVISGHGRGKDLGYPTLNLTIPDEFLYDPGIYAAWIWVEGIAYRGALHYGPIPVFQEDKWSLEVFLLDYEEAVRPIEVQLEMTEYLRPIENFPTLEAMQAQIHQDVRAVYALLQDSPVD